MVLEILFGSSDLRPWLLYRKGLLTTFPLHFVRFIYTTALDVLGKANRPVEALNVFHSMHVLYIYFYLCTTP